jgi:hypothetical protein
MGIDFLISNDTLAMALKKDGSLCTNTKQRTFVIIVFVNFDMYRYLIVVNDRQLLDGKKFVSVYLKNNQLT